MGYDVFTSIMCPVHDRIYNKDIGDYIPAPFEEIANKHLSLLEKKVFPPRVCIHFLNSVADGKCVFGGSKGEGLCWAAERNGGGIDEIADYLKPYFIDMWQSRVIPAYHGIVMTSNGEAEGRTEVVELRLSPDAENKVRHSKKLVEDDVVIRKFEEEWFVKFRN